VRTGPRQAFGASGEARRADRFDTEALASPEAVKSFNDFVTVEHELLSMLQEMLEQDREMLAMMRGT
jgi:hypothetical protein